MKSPAHDELSRHYRLSVDIEGVKINPGIQVSGHDFRLAFKAWKLIFTHNIAQNAVYHDSGRHLVFQNAVIDVGIRVACGVRIDVLYGNIPGVVERRLPLTLLDDKVQVEFNHFRWIGAVDRHVPHGAQTRHQPCFKGDLQVGHRLTRVKLEDYILHCAVQTVTTPAEKTLLRGAKLAT